MTVYEFTASRPGRSYTRSFEHLSVAWLERTRLMVEGWQVSEPVPVDSEDAAPLYATDAGQMCLVCHRVVSWVDHLPQAGGPVRCFTRPTVDRPVEAPQLSLVRTGPPEPFEGRGDFNSGDPFERWQAHQAAKGHA